jgi:hypothetical protein
VPSHFGYGKKRDFLESVEYAKTLRRLSVEAFEKFGVPTRGDGWVESYEYVYEPLQCERCIRGASSTEPAAFFTTRTALHFLLAKVILTEGNVLEVARELS